MYWVDSNLLYLVSMLKVHHFLFNFSMFLCFVISILVPLLPLPMLPQFPFCVSLFFGHMQDFSFVSQILNLNQDLESHLIHLLQNLVSNLQESKVHNL